jgi:hypothetical protein
VDSDGDSYGYAGTTTSACSAPSGYVANSTDCNDSNSAINPGATEICDGVDNDCDGLADEGLGATTYYADMDSDSYGDSGTAVSSCTSVAGYVTNSTDCDDTDAAINPAATEVCDGVDNDCDGSIDEGLSYTTYYADSDADTYGDSGTAVSSCSAVSGYVTDATDCDDTDAAVNPAATEVCDGVDNDCDGSIDEGLTTTYYADADSDTYGDSSMATTACSAPAGYVTDASDCDDTNAAVNPAATETCNGVDDDCDGLIDEGVGTTTYYADADGDGYGDALTSTTACSAPAGYVTDSTDCDDTSAAVNPAATEVCDTIDNDCDGSVDEGGVCPCDVETYNGHVYQFCGTATTWTSARTTCLTYGYDLVEIDDAAENDWVATTAYSYANTYWWIGLNDSSTEGTYVWSTGAAASYTNWASTEPAGKANKDCVRMRSKQKDWHEHTCGSSQRYVCEE